MGGLPAGVVTFVLTDVVGSIKLWHDAPDTMMQALLHHDQIIDEVVSLHGGHQVKPRGEGDSRLLVFERARDAVAAVADIQVKFAETEWPTPRPITVRVALNTGEADQQQGDYYGQVVNRTARMRDLAVGGQILISHSTMEAMEGDLPAGITTVDLGEHHLRDLPDPERIFQVNPPGHGRTFAMQRLPQLELRLIGPLEAHVDTVTREIASARQRAILTYLAIHVGQPIPWERLVEGVWGDDAPASGKKAVGFHISQLRDALQPDRTPDQQSPISTRQGGYALDVEPEDVDIHLFERLVSRAREEQDPKSRAAIAGEAIALWRGDPFSGLRYEEFTQRETARLEDLRLEAHELRAGAHLELDDPAGALDDLAGLLEEQPYREGLAVLKALALYRSARQVDALEVIETTRSSLREDLGLDPGQDLLRLEQDILSQSPHLVVADKAPFQGALPEATDSFVGREAEISQIESLFHGSRLVTLVGLGGIGKSRLALEAARRAVERFHGAVWFVELARVRADHQVVHSIAETLGVVDVTESDLTVACADHVGDAEALIVVDNCEHVHSTVAEFTEALMRRCPRLHLLATSRVALGLQGERAMPVGPLAATEDVTSAVELFIDRASAALEVDLDVDLVAEICGRLGGIPLAIELAASRLSVLSLQGLNEELERSGLKVLSSTSASVPERQKALTSIIDWSVDAAGGPAADVLEALSVFRGGFALDAAVAVAVAGDRIDTIESLDHLVSQSLVVRGRAKGDVRFGILEPVREHVGAKLRLRGEYHNAVLRHRDYFTTMTRSAYDEITGGDQETWMERLDVEADNVRAALDRAADQPEAALAIASRFWRYCLYRGLAREGIEWLAPHIWHEGNDLNDRLLGLFGHGVLSSVVGDLDAAEGSLVACRDLASEGDQPHMVASAATGLSGVYFLRGDAQRAVETLQESLEISAGLDDRAGECLAICKLAYVLVDVGRNDEAAALISRGDALTADVPTYIGAEWSLTKAVVAEARGELEDARQLHTQALQAGVEGRFLDQQAWALYGLGNVALGLGEVKQAGEQYSSAVRLFDEIGEMEGMIQARALLAVTLALRGQVTQARSALAHSLRSAVGSSRTGTAMVHESLGISSATAGDAVEAAASLGRASRIRSDTSTVPLQPLPALLKTASRSVVDELGDDRFSELFDAGAAGSSA